MPFILPGILVIGLFTLVVWWQFFRAAIRRERTVRDARRREVDFERLLLTPNEPLYCVACREIFRGPLGELGCPSCHVQAFVIPACTSEETRVVGLVRGLPPLPVAGEEDNKASSDTLATPRDRTLSETRLRQGKK